MNEKIIMSESTRSAQITGSINKLLGLNTLKGRYLLVMLVIAVSFFSAMWFAYSLVDQSVKNIHEQTAQREEAQQVIHKITRDVWKVEHSLQAYILSPARSQRDTILDVLRQIRDTIPKLTTSDLLSTDLLSNNLLSNNAQVTSNTKLLDSKITKLETELVKLMDVRSDMNLRFPATLKFLNKMLAANQGFSTAASLASREALNIYQESNDHFQVYHDFNELRRVWNQLISTFRIYLTSRIGMFVNNPFKDEHKQTVDIILYMDQINSILKRLELLNNKGSLGFLEAESLSVMKSESVNWYSTYKETKRIYDSKEWRADVPLLENSVQPLFVEILDSLSALDNAIDYAGFGSGDSLFDTVDQIYLKYWFLILLGLVTIISAYVFFEYRIRRPIVRVAMALKHDVYDEVFDDVIYGSGLEESRDLVDLINSVRLKLSSNQNKLDTILNNIDEGLVTVDEHGNIEAINHTAEKLLGYNIEEIEGENISRFVPRAKPLDPETRSVKLSGDKLELVAQHKDGHTFPISLKYFELFVNEKRCFFGVISDLSEKNCILENLQKASKHDDVTGLFNRNYFRISLDTALMDASLNNGLQHTLLFINIDNFKFVNDALGYYAGDLLLVEVTKLLQKEIRKDDVIARLGSDTFTVLLGDTNDELAHKIAEAIRRRISELIFKYEDNVLMVNCSIGISIIHGNNQDTDGIISEAESACNRAKSDGKNRTYIFDKRSRADRETRSHDIIWSQKIRSAIDENRLALAYQPLVNTTTNRAESYEILIRMLDENNQLIPPFHFLPTAERYGLAADIDKWVITKAMEVLVEMRKAEPQLRFAINLSGQTFTDRSVCELIKKSIKKHGLEPSALTFEVTETIAISDMNAANGLLTELSRMGCKTALDDFGSGMSSFAYLKELPIDIVKIDGQFVKNLAKNLVDQAMVKAMHDVAHALGKQTVGEFVEDKESFNLLRKMGVTYGQGYFLGKPEIIYPYNYSEKVVKIKS